MQWKAWAVQRAREDDAIRLVDRLVDRHLQPEPRMPTIMQFSENGLVGVLKRCCITAGDRIRALTARHPIKPTSPRCQSAWQPNPGRRSTYRRGKSVQTTGPTSGTVARLLMGRAHVAQPGFVAALRILLH